MNTCNNCEYWCEYGDTHGECVKLKNHWWLYIEVEKTKIENSYGVDYEEPKILTINTHRNFYCPFWVKTTGSLSRPKP